MVNNRRRPHDEDDELEALPASESVRRSGSPVQPAPRPAPPAPPRNPLARRPPPAKPRSPLPLILGIVGGVLAVLALLFCGTVGFIAWGIGRVAADAKDRLSPPANADEALAKLRSGDPIRRQFALDWLAQAPADDAHRAEVVAALQPLFAEADPFLHEPVAKALANWAGRDEVPLLLKLLNDHSDGVRQAAMEGLARLKDERAAAPLTAQLENFFGRDRASRALEQLGPVAEKEVVKYAFHHDNGVRDEARRLLRVYGTKDAVLLDQAVADLKAHDGTGREAVVNWLLQATPDEGRRAEVTRALEPALGDGNVFLHEPAGRALARWASKDNVPELTRALDNESAKVRAAASEALGRLGDERAAAPLARRLGNSFEGQQVRAALQTLGPVAEKEVVKQFNSPEQRARDDARVLLRGYGTKDAVVLVQTVEDLKAADPARRRSAAEWLAALKQPDEALRANVAGALEGLLEDNDLKTGEAAVKALKLWATKDSVPALVKVVNDPAFTPHSNLMGDLALEVLGKVADERGAEAVAQQLANPFRWQKAVKALEAMGAVAEKPVTKYVEDKDANVRTRAWTVLATVGTKPNLNELQTVAAQERDRNATAAAQKALSAIKAR